MPRCPTCESQAEHMVRRDESGEFPAGPAIRVCHGREGAYIHVVGEEDGEEGQIPTDMPVATSEDPPAAIREFHAQDWLIVIEALVAWAGNPNDPEMLTNPRKGRAWGLVSTIASEQDFPDEIPLKHVDDSWGAGRTETDGK